MLLLDNKVLTGAWLLKSLISSGLTKSMYMEYEISSPVVYDEMRAAIVRLMTKEDLTPEELEKLYAMAIAVEIYENEVLCLKPLKP